MLEKVSFGTQCPAWSSRRRCEYWSSFASPPLPLLPSPPPTLHEHPYVFLGVEQRGLVVENEVEARGWDESPAFRAAPEPGAAFTLARASFLPRPHPLSPPSLLAPSPASSPLMSDRRKGCSAASLSNLNHPKSLVQSKGSANTPLKTNLWVFSLKEQQSICNFIDISTKHLFVDKFFMKSLTSDIFHLKLHLFVFADIATYFASVWKELARDIEKWSKISSAELLWSR